MVMFSHINFWAFAFLTVEGTTKLRTASVLDRTAKCSLLSSFHWSVPSYDVNHEGLSIHLRRALKVILHQMRKLDLYLPRVIDS